MSGIPSAFRCLVSGDRVRVRSGHGGWRPFVVGDGVRSAPTVAAVCASLLGAHADRTQRLDVRARAALVAARVALDGIASARRTPATLRPAFLWVAAEDGCGAADRAFWATAEDAGGVHASPQRFVATLPSSVAGEIALILGLRGPSIVTTGSAPPSGGVDPAALDVATGAADVLLCVSIFAPASHCAAEARVLAVAVPLAPRRATSPGRRSPRGRADGR